MKQTPIKLGPLALLLTVISICLAVLSMLSFSTAQADLRLAEKYAETVRTRYELETEGQELLSRLDAGSPGVLGLEQDADGIWNTELEQDNAKLRIGVKKSADGGWEPVVWRHEKEWEEDVSFGNIWDGGFRFGD